MNVSKGQRAVVVAAIVAIVAIGAGASAVQGQTQGEPKAKAKATAKVAAKGAADTAEDDAKAEEIYKTKCSVCHAMDGNSPLPNMSFADGIWKHGTTVEEMVQTISNGVPGTAMMPFKTQFSEAEIEALARHVRKFDKKLE